MTRNLIVFQRFKLKEHGLVFGHFVWRVGGRSPPPAHIVFDSVSLQWILSICFSSSFFKWKGRFEKTGYIFLTNLEIPYAKFLCKYFCRWLLLVKSFPLKSRVDSSPSVQRGSLHFNFKPDHLQFQGHSKITHAHQSDVQTVDITYAKFQPTWDKEFGACIWESLFFSFLFFGVLRVGCHGSLPAHLPTH